MTEPSLSFEFFAGVSILLTLGSAWTHLAVKLDRIERRQRIQARCQKRIRIRLHKVERWLPPK